MQKTLLGRITSLIGVFLAIYGLILMTQNMDSIAIYLLLILSLSFVIFGVYFNTRSQESIKKEPSRKHDFWWQFCRKYFLISIIGGLLGNILLGRSFLFTLTSTLFVAMLIPLIVYLLHKYKLIK